MLRILQNTWPILFYSYNEQLLLGGAVCALFIWDITRFTEWCRHDCTGLCTGLTIFGSLGVLIAFASPLEALIIWLAFTSGLARNPLLLQLILSIMCSQVLGFVEPSCSYYCLCSQLCSLLCFRGELTLFKKGRYRGCKVLKFVLTGSYIILKWRPRSFFLVSLKPGMSWSGYFADYTLGISDLILASRTAANRDASLVLCSWQAILIGIDNYFKSWEKNTVIIIDRGSYI